MNMKQNVEFSTALLSQFLVFSLCLFLSMNTYAQKPYLSATMEPDGKSMQTQDKEESTNTLETPIFIQTSSQALQKQQKSGVEEITLDGPFCNGCDDPKGGSSLACTGGSNFIIQGIDISSMSKAFFVNSIDFNQESFGGAPNVRVRLFCGTAGTVLHSEVETAVYTETFTTKKSNDGKCVTLELTTPPTIDSECGTTLWIEFRTTGGKRVVSTPAKCNGKNATGNLSYIRAPSCSHNTPKKFKNVGFKSDASFAINVTKLLSFEGLEYCASEEKTTLRAVGDFTSYLWSNGATTQAIEVVDGTYAVTVTNADDITTTDEVTVTQIPCLAEAGTLTTNASTICGGGSVEVSTVNEKKDENYTQHFFLYTQDNLGNTILHESMIADYEEGEASAVFNGLMAGDYLVCAYNESQDCLPNPSPITTDLDDIYDTGLMEDGCFEMECSTITVPEVFESLAEGTGLAAENNAAGQNIYIAEVCGGTAPYSFEFTSSGGFANVETFS
ncbi:MAG: hypothetical protein ACPGVB_10830, partial [Chitinophagales bacterium]